MPNNSFRKVKVDKRSGFDKSFRNTLTGKCGTLVPILVDEWCPDTKVHLRESLAAALPPLVSDTYMNVRLRVEAFVVPHRLCQANFEDFYCDYPVEVADTLTDPTSSVDKSGCMPLIRLNASNGSVPSGVTSKSSLCDYFGITSFGSDYDFDVPVAPFVAYHLIWQEWYRNPRVQKSAFIRGGYHISQYYNDGASHLRAVNLPYTSCYFDSYGVNPLLYGTVDGEGNFDLSYYKLHDDVYITDLRQRNFGLDFFTAAMVEPQQGEMAKVVIESSGGVDSFTISSLRAQNSIQQFRERNGLTSPRYQQQIYARYGVAPSDGVIQRPVLIGAATYDVYSHGVSTVAQSVDNPESSFDQINPFGGAIGSRYGNGFASGSDFLIEDFHAKEPMYLIVLASLVPEVTYSQLFNPIFTRYKGLGSITDMANGILQNVGPQPIYNGYIHPATSSSLFYGVFAYTDRYSDWMIMVNQCHGEMNEYKSGTLKSFVLQRTFSGAPDFGSEFLTIPTNFLDSVTQFDTETIGLTYWLDIAFDYKVSMPLQEYAIPSLQDPGYEHGRTITLRKNGQLL